MAKSQLDTTNESQEVSSFQQVTTSHKKTDTHKGITNTRQKNINDPQKKYRLGMVSNNILLKGLNRLHGTPTSPLVQMWIKTQTQNINNTDDPQKNTALERSVKIFYWRAETGFTVPASPLIQMWIKTHRYLEMHVRLIIASSPRTYKSRNKKKIKQR